MSWTRTAPCLILWCSLLASAGPADAQILDRLKKNVEQAKSTIDDAREIRCDVDGTCGEVWESDLFTPEIYQSLAVTAVDGTRRFDSGAEGMVRNVFEGQLLENGFLLAASADAEAVRERIGRSEDEWSDEQLAQLSDFVHGIDAVVFVQVDQVELSRCEMEGDQFGTEATVHLSARWLNVDAGDIPWVARHRATACEDGGMPALTTALDEVSSQLAGTLPVLE